MIVNELLNQALQLGGPTEIPEADIDGLSKLPEVNFVLSPYKTLWIAVQWNTRA